MCVCEWVPDYIYVYACVRVCVRWCIRSFGHCQMAITLWPKYSQRDLLSSLWPSAKVAAWGIRCRLLRPCSAGRGSPIMPASQSANSCSSFYDSSPHPKTLAIAEAEALIEIRQTTCAVRVPLIFFLCFSVFFVFVAQLFKPIDPVVQFFTTFHADVLCFSQN